jgi:hypothetical protein
LLRLQGWREHSGFRREARRGERTHRGLEAQLLVRARAWGRDTETQPEGETRAELRAALADLRHLEGFLASVGREHRVSSLSSADEALSEFAERQTLELSRIADGIEEALGARA